MSRESVITSRGTTMPAVLKPAQRDSAPTSSETLRPGDGPTRRGKMSLPPHERSQRYPSLKRSVSKGKNVSASESVGRVDESEYESRRYVPASKRAWLRLPLPDESCAR